MGRRELLSVRPSPACLLLCRTRADLEGRKSLKAVPLQQVPRSGEGCSPLSASADLDRYSLRSKARHLGLLEKRRRRKSHAALRRSAVHKEIRRGARVATVGRPPQPAKTSQATIALHAKRKGNPAATAFASPIARRRSRPARSVLFRAGGSAGGPHLAAAGPRSPAPLGSRLARTEG